MKFPQNLVLDYGNNNSCAFSKYWIFYFFNLNDENFKNYSIFLSKFFLINHNFNSFFSIDRLASLTLKKKILNNFIKYKKKKTKKKTKTKTKLSMAKILKIRKTVKKGEHKIKRIFSKFFLFKNKMSSVAFFSKKLFDINFLRKEKIYTKLKYSRVPQYDIVSGGSAALLAGFLGFLICEKFGFELLDSGDFYFLFMYVVFLSFFFKLWTKLVSSKNNNWNIFGFKWLNYYILTLFNFFKNLINLN